MIRPRLWFAGTPKFAAYSLKALLDSGAYDIQAVLTQPDRPAGRGRKLTASPVKQTALAHDIPIAQPDKLRENDPPFPHLPPPDVMIVAAYGLLLPQWMLDFPRLGCLNIHASLLPRWRGAAPIQRAIEAGDAESGVCIMQMEAGLDTGPVWRSASLPIHDTTDAGELHDALMVLGAQTLLDTLPEILQGQGRPEAQDDTQATYARKLDKAEAAIDWQGEPALIARRIRAFSPFPVAHARLDGETVRIHQAFLLGQDGGKAAGTVVAHHEDGLDIALLGDTLRVVRMQLPGKAAVAAADLRHGRNLIGQRFS